MRLSNCDDQSERNHLYETANVILTRPPCHAHFAPPEFDPAGGGRAAGPLQTPFACVAVPRPTRAARSPAP